MVYCRYFISRRTLDMTASYIGDTSLGVGHQALAVLQYLARMEPAFATYKGGFYDVMIDTRTWYNGRERGICISMNAIGMGSRNVVHVAVFEHRNSDEIIGLTWETEHTYLNGPNKDFDNVLELAYGPNGTKYDWDASFHSGEVGKCADWVYDTLEKAYRAWAEKALTAQGVWEE
jgi:hypothetical protein